MIIIPGLAKSGTSYLTNKIHKTGNKMYGSCDKHYEDTRISHMLSWLFIFIFGSDKWYLDEKDRELLTPLYKQFIIERIKESVLDDNLQGFKNPRLIYFIPELLEAFPDAKIVICIRDYESWIEGRRRKKKNFHLLEKEYENHYNYVMKDIVIKYCNDDRITLFNYSTGNLVHQQLDLFRFLRLDFDMSDFKPKVRF